MKKYTIGALFTPDFKKVLLIEKQRQLDKIQDMMKPWSTDELRMHIKQRAKLLPFYFEADQDNRFVIELLCLYFSGNSEFEKHGFKDKDGNIIQQYSLKKGIVLHSKERGTGKTVLMELFSINRRGCFVMRYYEGMKVNDIAEQLGIDHSSVSTAIKRGLIKLKSLI